MLTFRLRHRYEPETFGRLYDSKSRLIKEWWTSGRLIVTRTFRRAKGTCPHGTSQR